MQVKRRMYVVVFLMQSRREAGSSAVRLKVVKRSLDGVGDVGKRPVSCWHRSSSALLPRREGDSKRIREEGDEGCNAESLNGFFLCGCVSWVEGERA